MANFLTSNDYSGDPSRAQLLGPDGMPFRKDSPDAGFAVPHSIHFASLLSSGFRSYWHAQYDEAIKHSREDAIAMRNDAFLMALLQERKLATASLRWSIQVDDERDPMQKAVQDGLTRIVRRIPRFRRFIMYMLEAIWYGRYASQIKWGWARLKMPSIKNPKQDEDRRCLVIKNHEPVNGDKIGHHWDGTPYLLVNPSYAINIKNADITPSTAGGLALYLRGSWRWRYCVHTHEAVDADYFDSNSADAVHGLGIRSVLFWLDWLRKEWLSNVADWCERTGLGIRLWYYQGNNPASKTAVEKAARESNDRTNLFIPRFQGGQGQEGVELVDTSSTGADLLLRLQQHIEEIQERYVIGQSLTGGRGQGDSLGGEGKAKLAEETKDQIRNFDAGNLGETLTTDILRLIQYWTFTEPEARQVNARFVFNTDDPDPEKLLNAIKTYVIDLGGKVRAAMVDQALGLEAPQEGDDVISIESIGKQKNAAAPQPPAGMPGSPGAPPAGGQDPMEAIFGGKGKQPAKDEKPEEDEGGEDEEQDEPGPGTDHVRRKGGDDDDLDAGIEDVMRRQRDGAPERFAKHSFSSTQFNLTGKTLRDVQALADSIRDEDLAEKGRESEIHLTVKYGLHTDDWQDVEDVVRGFGPVSVTLSDTSIFAAHENESQRGGADFDVVKIDVEGDRLRQLNRLLADRLPHTDSFPEYRPHVTLAYVMPGEGQKYVGMSDLRGTDCHFTTLVFSNQDGAEKVISLLP